MKLRTATAFFKGLLNRYRNRAFISSALPKTTQMIEELFTTESSEEMYTSIKALKQRGPEEVAEFREYMINEVLGIARSNNPVIALRKALIENIRLDRQSRLLLADEFRDRRQVIYKELNKSVEDLELLWSDHRVSTMAIWTEAESLLLRHLQKPLLEKGTEVDWWSSYIVGYGKYVENVYRSILAKADGHQSSVYSAFVKASYKVVEDMEHELTAGS
jgi:hypothetical protein